MIPFDDDSIGYQLQDSSGGITALLFSDKGHLVSSTSGGGVNMWDLSTRKGLRIISEPSGITALDISDSNAMLAELPVRQADLWHNGMP
jgi:WD40 repeat protein